MRISHKYKFVFFSKPKCASTSIRKALDPYSDIVSEDRNKHFHHHVPPIVLKKHFEQQGWDWDSYFKFICVRNPWDMLVSLYHYGKPDKNGRYFWEAKNSGYDPTSIMDFNEWILKGKSWDAKSSQHLNDMSAYSLNYYTLDDDYTFLVDYVVKVEDLNSELAFLSKLLGININFYHINKSDHSYYKAYYNQQAITQVSKVFDYDIRYGGYSFDE